MIFFILQSLRLTRRPQDVTCVWPQGGKKRGKATLPRRNWKPQREIGHHKETTGTQSHFTNGGIGAHKRELATAREQKGGEGHRTRGNWRPQKRICDLKRAKREGKATTRGRIGGHKRELATTRDTNGGKTTVPGKNWRPQGRIGDHKGGKSGRKPPYQDGNRRPQAELSTTS